MNNVVEAENLKATIKTMDGQVMTFEKNMQNNTLAGATIKKIEREISVSEQGCRNSSWTKSN
jgi:hypothetical protein